MGELAGKQAIVTGGTRGIGLATVRELASAGAAVIFTGTSQAGVDAALGQIDGSVLVTGKVCDMRDADGMHDVLADGCDILINNAAVSTPVGELHTLNADSLRRLFEIDLIAAVEWARHAAACMIERGGGTIVNLSSGAAHHAIPMMGPYCVAKSGLAMASNVLDAELSDRGVRVYSFAPGVVDTDMQTEGRESGLFKGILPDDRSQLLAPEVPARAIRWLCATRDPRFAGRRLSIIDEDLKKAMAG